MDFMHVAVFETKKEEEDCSLDCGQTECDFIFSARSATPTLLTPAAFLYEVLLSANCVSHCIVLC